MMPLMSTWLPNRITTAGSAVGSASSSSSASSHDVNGIPLLSSTRSVVGFQAGIVSGSV